MICFANQLTGFYMRRTLVVKRLTRLHVDKEICKEMRNAVQNVIRKKEQVFEEKLKENNSNPKSYRKRLNIGLPGKRLPSSGICLKAPEGLNLTL